MSMSHKELLEHHGWKQAIGGGWTHENHKGSVILADNKDWLHSPASSKKKATKGVGNDSLAMHLTHLDALHKKSSQHSEQPEVEQFSESDALRHLSKFGYKYKGEEKATGQQLYNHDNGHGVSVSKGGKDWYHHGPKGTNIVHGSGYNKLVSHLKSYHSSQHSEQPEVEQFGDEEHVKGIYHGSVAMVPGDKRRSKFKNLVEQHGGHLNAYDQIYLPKKNLQEFHKSASASEFRHGLGKSNHYHIPQDSQHSEQEDQPDRSYTEHLRNGGKPFIQRHVAEVVPGK